MAFKASSIILVTAYERIKTEAAAVKRRSERLRDQSAAGAISADLIIDWVHEQKNRKDAMAALAATPGLVAYAKNQEDDGTYDVVSEYNAMITGIDTVIEWVDSNFPQDGSGYLLKDQMAVDGTITPRAFSTAATAGMRTELDALIALID